MERRTFIKSLGAVPFIPSLDWKDKEGYYRYYFGGLATGKTTRLINDAFDYLINNKSNGLFVVSIYPQLKYVLTCIPEKRKLATFSKYNNTFSFANGSTLYLIAAGDFNQTLSIRYQSLWTDEITSEYRKEFEIGKRISLERHNSRIQHVISMNDGRFFNNLPIYPHKLSRALWGIKGE